MTRSNILPISIVLLSLVSLLPSCGRQESLADNAAINSRPAGAPGIDSPIMQENEQNAFFSDEELARIQEIRDSGGIRAGVTSLQRGSFFENLFDEALTVLDIQVSRVQVDFQQFFTINGEIPDQIYSDPEYNYIPDIFRQVDVLVTDITVLPWREKILSFVPILPTRIVMISRAEDHINSPEDLNGKKVLTSPGTSFELVINNLVKEYNLEVTMVPVDPTTVFAELVHNRTVDVAPNDSIYAMEGLKNYEGLALTMPLSDIELLGWAVGPKDSVLQSILEKTVDLLKANGSYSRLFEKYFSMSDQQYLDLIAYY